MIVVNIRHGYTCEIGFELPLLPSNQVVNAEPIISVISGGTQLGLDPPVIIGTDAIAIVILIMIFAFVLEFVTCVRVRKGTIFSIAVPFLFPVRSFPNPGLRSDRIRRKHIRICHPDL